MNDSTDTDTDSDPVPAPRSDSRTDAASTGEVTPSADGPIDPADASASAPEGRDAASTGARPVEIGGQKGPEPTRYGDWEKKGRCTDF